MAIKKIEDTPPREQKHGEKLFWIGNEQRREPGGPLTALIICLECRE
jgi:hypothetical protein